MLADCLLEFGKVRRAEGDFGGAAADWRRANGVLETIRDPNAGDVFLAACSHALLSDLAGAAGARVPAGEREAEATRAMALLRKAIAMGLADPATYRAAIRPSTRSATATTFGC